MAVDTPKTEPAYAGALPAAKLMLWWVAFLWVLEAVDTALGHSLDSYGITPRIGGELRDVVPAAFLHAGWDHLASNTVPLLVLGFLTAAAGLRTFLGVVLTIIVVSGLGVWLASPPNTVTLGASGVVFGLLGYLLVRGLVDRRLWDLAIGVVVAVLYGSLLWGVLPTDSGVSWQGHLLGLVGGVLAAFLFRRSRAA
ncbi:rhomboid family intramembrane serine protease [Streptomyces sp. NPDC002490]|uniref:rhomboid family intramembrane serine protease n=1 Tax=Streptomyces sp. NPDC002490 TaxID=3154416 RepID=UPI0033290245